MYQDNNDQASIDALVKRWLDKLPTDPTANILNAQNAERRGDLLVAREGYRRAYALGDNMNAGFAYARICLGTQNYDEALATLNKLRASGFDPAHIGALEGSVLVMQGRLGEAQERLEAAAEKDLGNAELNTLARYNLGYLYWRQSKRGAALRQWEGLNHPAATFAEHHVRRREIRDRNVLQHPVLGSLAAELNAVLALEKGDASRHAVSFSQSAMRVILF